VFCNQPGLGLPLPLAPSDFDAGISSWPSAGVPAHNGAFYDSSMLYPPARPGPDHFHSASFAVGQPLNIMSPKSAFTATPQLCSLRNLTSNSYFPPSNEQYAAPCLSENGPLAPPVDRSSEKLQQTKSAKSKAAKKTTSSTPSQGQHAICVHNKRRTLCKLCGGGSICQHGLQRPWCRQCGGGARCQHGKQKSRCKICGGAGICQHGRLRGRCSECKVANEAQASSAADVFQASTAADVFQASSAADVFQASTAADVFQASSAADVFQASSAADVFQASSAADVLQKAA
jgi:hypothetical protein